MRYILLLQNEKALAYATGRRGGSLMVEFENTDSGRQKLLTYLRERVNSVFSILLDFTEEEHHRCSIPRLRGRDLRDMLNRLENRYFPGSTLCCATVDKQADTGSGKLTVGITGLPASNDADPWFTVLSEAQTIVASIGSISLHGTAIISSLKKAGSLEKADNQSSGQLKSSVFVVAQLGLCDFRLSVYLKGALLISRRLHVKTDLASTIGREVSQTQSWLDRLPEHSEITGRIVLILGNFNDGQIDELKMQVSGEVFVYRPNGLAAKMKLNTVLASPYADGLFVQLQSRRFLSRFDFSRADHRVYYWRKRLTHGLYAVCISLMGSAAVTAAATSHLDGEFQILTQTVQRLDDQARATTETIGRDITVNQDGQYSIAAMRESMQIARRLQSNIQASPFQFLALLASDLSTFPGVQITDVAWAAPDTGITSDALIEATRYPLDPGAAVVANQKSTGTINATISGYIDTGDAGISAVLSTFHSFMRALRSSQLHNTVTVLEAPFGISDSSMTSDAGFSDGAGRGTFLLEIVTGEVVR